MTQRPECLQVRRQRRGWLRSIDGNASGLSGLLSTCLLLALAICNGCVSSENLQMTHLPNRHSVRAKQLLMLSDFKLSQTHPLFQDLISLRREISETLQLPEESREVVVYLFSNEQDYRKYLDTTYPGLPPRRAYFVGTPKQLAVYTFWGERIQEDLRHEFTHGLLHAALIDVPLWLDEGLAEYFEVLDGGPTQINREYVARLNANTENQWQPDLERLEMLQTVGQMQQVDYQEAWAWVHYMLHGTPDTRGLLLAYLDELRTNAHPVPLSSRLAESAPHLRERFLQHVALLNSSTTVGMINP